MSPSERAIQMRRDAEGHIPGEPVSSRSVLRSPGRGRKRRDDDSHLDTQGDDEDFVDGLHASDIHSMSEEDKVKALAILLKRNDERAARAHALEMKDNELDIEHKRKFVDLAIKMAKGFAISALLFVMVLVSLITYGVVFDKSIIDSALITGFLDTFGEVFKAILSTL